MSCPVLPTARSLCAAATLLVVSACGGGTPTAPPAPAGPTPRARALAAQPLDGATPTLVVKARGTLAAGVGPVLEVRVNGTAIGSVEVRASAYSEYRFPAAGLGAGARVDLVYTNDASIDGADRNLFVAYATDGVAAVAPDSPGVVLDAGSGAAALDGLDTGPGQSALYGPGALRFTWPATAVGSSTVAAQNDAARFLMQATFGATQSEIDRLQPLGYGAWIDDQQAKSFSPVFLYSVQDKFNLGPSYLPGGSRYDTRWVGQKFWSTAATAPDQLRRRVAWALQQIFVVSMADPELYNHSRPYAAYLDTLAKYAFGNYRTLLEEVALSPATGVYLSHLHNPKEDPKTGRRPDENFAREVMQLFSIGLYELNPDGTRKLDAGGQPIETYTNDDVMAMAQVFSGWSWALPDSQLTPTNFWNFTPDYATTGDARVDLKKMKAYPSLHSTAEKHLFAGKPWAVTLPANASAGQDLKVALDTLFRHPNVGPFIGRQLIQRLVTSNPSPAYVARVAAVFDDNGQGVRGDLGAVVRAILLDTEARAAPPPGFGRLREPVLRVTQWMRAFGAKSASGEYLMAPMLDDLAQRAVAQPSVFNYFRPGYIPPQTDFAARGATAPEFQIVDESTAAGWVNTAQTLAGNGAGWTGSAFDVTASYGALATLAGSGGPTALMDALQLLLFAGRMSPTLRSDITDAMLMIGSGGTNPTLARIRLAVFLAMASPEYLAQL